VIDRGTLDRVREQLDSALGSGRTAATVVLAPFTTFKVGGPADLFVEPRSGDELIRVLEIVADAGVPVTMLGGGSNVLIADGGVRGVVVRPRGGTIAQVDSQSVRADAAVAVNGLVRWTIGRGLAGLEAWAGTPGTVGGGVYGNAHWRGRLLSELLLGVQLWSHAQGLTDVPTDQMDFGYDRSRLQRTGEVLISALFRVTRGEPAALRDIARQSLAYRKWTQPLDTPSAGCIFQNPSPEDNVPAGVPRSAGALVDRAGLKGVRMGGATVSPTHGNFIVSDGTATARDISALIDQCRIAVRERFGIELRDEIVRIGQFVEEEPAGVHTSD
jgi:UDP-N-acetylmuramate dehydrogenase